MPAHESSPPKGTSTRLRLLQAAHELLGEEGMGALTHRRVEDRAGVSHGSTTYHFGTREQLIDALLEFNVERDHALMRRTSEEMVADESLRDLGPEALTWEWTRRSVAGMLADTHQRLCRYELYLYAARRPEVQEILRRYRNQVVAEHAATHRAYGHPYPEAASRVLLSMFEGLSIMDLSVPNEAQEAWAPTYLMAVFAAAPHLVEPPGAPRDEAADVSTPLLEHLGVLAELVDDDALPPDVR
ncbi:TetR/AcrR family transcriptional regulator [Actinomycetota bacterium]